MPESAKPGSSPVSELTEQLRASLSLTGVASAHVDDLDMAPDAWLQAARAAAFQLGRPVHATTVAGTVYAALRDWPATDEEAARERGE